MMMRKVDSLSAEQVEQLLSVIDDLRDYTIITLALATGLRRRDLARLEINNVDLVNRILRYYEEKKNRWREIPIEPAVARVLNMWLKEVKRKDSRYYSQKWLFIGNEKNHISDRTLHWILNKYLARIGLQMHFHGLRVTFVKLSKRAGRDIKTVEQITGDTPAVILKYYSNWTIDELRENVDKRPILNFISEALPQKNPIWAEEWRPEIYRR